jgi:hypothetical protein
MRNLEALATNFGFTGSQIGALPSTMDDVNPGYLDTIGEFVLKNGGRLSSINGIDLYDTVRINAGVMPTKEFIFYQNGVGQQQGLFISGATYTKQQIDVSPWVRNGQLSKGYEALIWSIQVQIDLVAALDESVQSSGNALNLTLDPGILSGEAATDAIKQANVLRAFQEGTYFEFFINQTPFEHGTPDRFPTANGIGGGIAVGGVIAAPFADGALTNGFGVPYEMPILRHIPEQTTFGIKMIVQNPFDLTAAGPVRIKTRLKGVGIGPVTG